MKNSTFAQSNELFQEVCKISQIEPTARQASKWRNKKGSAYKFYNERKGIWKFVVNQWLMDNEEV